jgi:predicted DNA-binding WGR domain protein
MPPIQLDMFPTDLFLASVDPARNRRRFYALSVERDLFGEWSLVRQWGRIGRPGRLRCDLYPSAGAALDALGRLARQKRRRGYETR